MKTKILFCLFCLTTLCVQGQVTFKPGLRAGANFAHFTEGDDYDNEYFSDPVYDPTFDTYYTTDVEFTNKTDFYIGFYGALRLTKYYTLQPELDYSRQGSTIEYTYNNVQTDTRLDVSYFSVGILNKFTFTEKFNVHIGARIDFVVDKTKQRPDFRPLQVDGNPSYAYTPRYYTDVDSDVDLAFVAGFGYNFTRNIGIEARIKKGIIPVLDLSDSSHTNVVYSLGGTYTFDLK